MASTWPVNFPQSQRTNLGITTTVPVFETPEELFSNRRLMFDDSWTIIPVTLLFTSTTYPLFLTWLRDEVGFGELEIIDFPLLDYDGVVRLFRCFMDGNTFESDFKLTVWSVTFKIRIRELTVPSENDLDAFSPI